MRSKNAGDQELNLPFIYCFPDVTNHFVFEVQCIKQDPCFSSVFSKNTKHFIPDVRSEATPSFDYYKDTKCMNFAISILLENVFQKGNVSSKAISSFAVTLPASLVLISFRS